jgi:hypothetical protein
MVLHIGFVFVASLEQHLFSYLVVIRNSFCILFFVVFVHYCLFSLSDKFPVCHMFNVEDHVSAEHKLTWRFSQGCVEG